MLLNILFLLYVVSLTNTHHHGGVCECKLIMKVVKMNLIMMIIFDSDDNSNDEY